MRDVIVKAMKLNESYTAFLDSQKTVLTEKEQKLIKTLRESPLFKKMAEADRDRHLYRQILTSVTVEPVSVVEKLCKRIPSLIEAGVLDKNLNVSRTLTESGMADVDAKNTQAKPEGMYGVGDGADKDEPSGDADTGVDQDGNHGDSSGTTDKGYLDEMDDVADPKHNQPKGDDDKKGVNEQLPPEFKKNAENPPPSFQKNAGSKDADDDGKYNENVLRRRLESLGLSKESINAALKEAEVPQDAPSSDSDEERAASGAKYKDGANQNESEDGQSGPVKDHKPQADDPGEPKAGTSGDKGETDDADTPDYSKVKAEDPSSSELNKGPAKADVTESFAVIERKILSMLESAGIPPGSARWNELYRKGFSYAIAERAKKYENDDDALNGDDDHVHVVNGKATSEPVEKKKK